MPLRRSRSRSCRVSGRYGFTTGNRWRVSFGSARAHPANRAGNNPPFQQHSCRLREVPAVGFCAPQHRGEIRRAEPGRDHREFVAGRFKRNPASGGFVVKFNGGHSIIASSSVLASLELPTAPWHSLPELPEPFSSALAVLCVGVPRIFGLISKVGLAGLPAVRPGSTTGRIHHLCQQSCWRPRLREIGWRHKQHPAPPSARARSAACMCRSRCQPHGRGKDFDAEC